MTEVYVPVSKLRQDVKQWKARLKVVKNMYNAIGLQVAEAALERFFQAERKFFVVIDGDSIPDPRHVPPTHFRVIDGGKEKALLSVRG